MVAQGLTAAAGLQDKQNWALILSSSARVSEVTFEMVVAVRYPELDADTPTQVVFGNYLADRKARIGGYLPVFWRSPHSVIHATGDIGQMMGLDSERFKHGGKHVKSGWHATKRTANRSSMTSRSCWRHFLTRKRLHSQKWMHSWRIAQRGGRLERVRTNSSVDVCQTFVTFLSIQERILTWRTSNNGQHGEVLRGGREHLRGWEGHCFTCLT